jgi:hypothetical protein
MARKEVYKLDSTFESSHFHATAHGTTVEGAYNDAEFVRIDGTAGMVSFGETKTSSQRHCSFFRFHTPTLPANSNILSVKLHLVAQADGDAANLDIACLKPDGLWNRVPKADAIPDPNNTKPGDFEVLGAPGGLAMNWYVELFDSGPATLGVVGTNAGFIQGWFKTYISDDIGPNSSFKTLNVISTYGQNVDIDTSGTIDTIDVRLFKTNGLAAGDPNASLKLRIWDTDANYRPVSVVAETDSIAYSSWSISTGFVHSFTVSGGLAVLAGETYMVEGVKDAGIWNKFSVNGINYESPIVGPNFRGETVGASEILYMVGLKTGGFGALNYPRESDLPYLYSGITGTTILNPPNGSIVTVAVPAQSTDTPFEIEGFEVPIQEWVNSPEYEENQRIIGLVWDSADHFDTNTQKWFRSVLSTDSDLTNPAIALEIEFEPSSEAFIT